MAGADGGGGGGGAPAEPRYGSNDMAAAGAMDPSQEGGAERVSTG